LDDYCLDHICSIIGQVIIEVLGPKFVKQWFETDDKDKGNLYFMAEINPYGEVISLDCRNYMKKKDFVTPGMVDSIMTYIRKKNVKFPYCVYPEGRKYDDCYKYILKDYFYGMENKFWVRPVFPYGSQFPITDTVSDIDSRLRRFYDFIHRYSAPTSREILASNGIKVFSTRSFIITDSPNAIYYDTELLDKYDEYVFSSYLSSNKGDSLRLAQNNVTLAAEYLKRFKRDDFFRQMCFRRALELDPGNKAASKYFKK